MGVDQRNYRFALGLPPGWVATRKFGWDGWTSRDVECREPSERRTMSTSHAPECRRKHEAMFDESWVPMASRPSFEERLSRKFIAEMASSRQISGSSRQISGFLAWKLAQPSPGDRQD